MKLCKTLSLFVLSLFLFSYPAPSQVSISTIGTGGTYSQTFSALTTSNFPLTDNTSITGIYAHSDAGSPKIFVADDGSSAAAEFKNYGSTGAFDRALGSLADTATTGNMFYGIRFQNDTGMTITSLEVRYVGEQWRNASASAQGFSFHYRQSAGDITDLTTGSYTGVPALDFITPQFGGSGTALDGNLPANRVQLMSTFAVTIPSGQEIMLRWTDFDDFAAPDHGIAIDDVVVIAFSGTTAADAIIGGRVTTAGGRGIAGARIVLAGGELAQPRYALTNAFGYYSFTAVESGQVYVLTINSKRYAFANRTRTVSLLDNVTDVDFVADP